MPRIVAHRNRAVLSWIWFRQIIEHVTLWGQECWRKQRRVKIHGQQDKLAKVGQSLCWDSPAREFSPIRKKASTTPNKGLKSPGRKCSRGGHQVHRGKATLRVKPSPVFSSSAFTSKLDHFSTGCYSQPHNGCAWACPYSKKSTVTSSLCLSSKRTGPITGRPDAPVLKSHSCQVSPCRNFYGWTEPHAGNRSWPRQAAYNSLDFWP